MHAPEYVAPQRKQAHQPWHLKCGDAPLGANVVEQPASPVDLFGRRRVGSADHLHLRRVNGGRGVEAAGHGVSTFVCEPGGIGDVEMDGIDRETPGRLGGDQGPGPRIAGDVAIAAVGVATAHTAEPRRQVLSAPHDCDDVVGERDLTCSFNTERCLEEGDHVEGKTGDVGGILGLGQHDPRDAAVLQRGEVQRVIGGAHGIHSDDGPGVVERAVCGEAAQRGAGGIPIARRDGILEIDDDDVGGGQGLGIALGAVGGAEQPGRSGRPSQLGAGFSHRGPSSPGSCASRRRRSRRAGCAPCAPW